MLGMNRIQLSIVLCLVEEGGTATSQQLQEKLKVGRPTLFRHLNVLEAQGIVVADLPANTRASRKVRWSFQQAQMHKILDDLKAQTTL